MLSIDQLRTPLYPGHYEVGDTPSPTQVRSGQVDDHSAPTPHPSQVRSGR